ncbi:hypothetical protein RyT2_08130 [Pseudolactococcus yaeyamensis]
MKIKQLRIEGFGKLVNQTYDLADFTTFLGENEAGKSTVLAFIKYMLFGFENATISNQEFNPLNFKTYGGQIFLTHADKTIRIERLKILRSGRPSFVCEIVEGDRVTMLDESSWRDFIRPITVKTFSEIYSVTQENLQISTVRDYNAERLDEEWRMSATTGSVALFDQVQLLSKARDDIFTTTRAAKKPLNQVLADIAAVQVEVQEKTSEEQALLPLMTENERLYAEIVAQREAQENLDAEINQIRHRLSFLAEYQEYAELKKQDLTHILSADEAENLRRKHVLHEKYSQEISALSQKIAEDTIALEKLATPKNQFLQELQTIDLLKRLKADYPQAIGAEQRINELKFTKIYLILAIISLILAGLSFIFSPILALVFFVVSAGLAFWQVKTNRQDKEKLAENEAILSHFEDKLAYFKDWLSSESQDVVGKVADLTQLDEEAQTLHLTLSRYDQVADRVKMQDLEALDEAIFAELPDIDTAPKLLEQWMQQSRDLVRLTRLKEQLSGIIDLTQPFNGIAEQQLLNQKTSEKIQKTAELNRLIDMYSKNTAVIDQQKTDTTLSTLAAKMARKKEILRDYLVDFATKTSEIALTEQVMAELSSETLPDILNRASKMLAILTDKNWQEIYLDKEILWVRNTQGQSLRLIDLSTGTRDQLQLALRLAFIQSKNLDFPIFLDDNFLRFDKKRRRNFSNMLAEVAKERQVILLTSDQTLVPETKGTIKL